jgi:hypothetical protein
MAVEVQTEPTFKLGKSKTLSDIRDMRQGSVFDISPDGKRFLMMREYTGDTSTLSFLTIMCPLC